MSVLFEGHPLSPRGGAGLRVLVVARISTAHQDERSLADQAAMCERYVRDRYHGPVHFEHIRSRGSGEHLDTAELAGAEDAVESRAFDLVVVEDLGRICRRNHALVFCEACEDCDTRLVAVNDAVDTARGDWRMHAFFASFKHESSNKDTANRIRRTLRNRFQQGQVVQQLVFGYVKPPGCQSDGDVSKAPGAQEVYDRWFAMLERGASYSEVADWLNSNGVPTGRWARQAKWDCRMVGRVTHNPLLKGQRRRNERVSKRVNKTGRRKSVKAAPGERLYREAPHLAFIEPARYDRLIARLAERNAAFARGRAARTPDGRAGVPRKRTVWPGQHLACGVCGRLYYWGGHGQQHRMMCSSARNYACWNAATLDGREAAARLAGALLAAAESLPEFDDAFLAAVRRAADAGREDRSESLRKLARDVESADQELWNLTDAVARMSFSAALGERLVEAEARKARLMAERAELLARPAEVPPLPPLAELKARARAEVGRLDFADPEFGRLMSRLVPEVEVFPHRPLDGGAVVLRARATVTLAPLAGPAADGLGTLLERSASVDLFDPPQRIAILQRAAALRAAGRTERQAAAELGVTPPAVQRAAALGRLMASAGTADPYAPLAGPPEGDGKFRRHEHARYRFRPLPGYPALPPDAP